MKYVVCGGPRAVLSIAAMEGKEGGKEGNVERPGGVGPAGQ